MNTSLPKLAAPAVRALASMKIKYLEDLTKFTEEEIADLHGMGPNAMKKLKEEMEEQNRNFIKE